jgi:hypothetical protein
VVGVVAPDAERFEVLDLVASAVGAPVPVVYL